jgi:hypothetical protein
MINDYYSDSSLTTPEDKDYFHTLFGDDAPTFNEFKSAPVNTKRMYSVFAKVTKETGYGIGAIGNDQSKERQTIKNLTTQALGESNPSVVKQLVDQMHALAIDPVVIHSVLKAIKDERANPGSSMVYMSPEAYHQSTTTQPANIVPSAPTTNVTPAASFYTKLPKTEKSMDKPVSINQIFSDYGVPYNLKQQALELFNDALGYSTHNSLGAKSFLENKLKNLGCEAGTAKNLSNLAQRLVKMSHPVALQAQTVAQQKKSIVQNPSVQTTGVTAQQVAHLTDTQDPTKLARKVTVKGEKVLFKKYGSAYDTQNGVPNWTVPADDHGHYSDGTKALGEQQHQWRMANLSTEDKQKFEKAAKLWEGSGQWSQKLKNRKFMNYIFTKVANGNPPSLTPVKDCLERGLSLSNQEDMEEFLQAFEVGKLTYLGPSGFSERKTTARSFGSSNSGGNFRVILRAFPQKTGQMKGIRIHDRPTSGHDGEKEVILGTSKNMRVREVIKHVVEKNSHGQVNVCYEIVMDQEPDHIIENKNIITDGGFDVKLWKGLSRNTIKMLIKYMNSSFDTRIH